jgi:hypothetical protein
MTWLTKSAKPPPPVQIRAAPPKFPKKSRGWLSGGDRDRAPLCPNCARLRRCAASSRQARHGLKLADWLKRVELLRTLDEVALAHDVTRASSQRRSTASLASTRFARRGCQS